ncbi:ammonium transporter (TC 1.A.11) [Alkalibacter saccharofermentans DSM 14828]|uniref:Ammonium transporter n=2 Tax=Alkalibacter TaxID=274470 RepID=A0A1M4YWW0_9FIRM|nr:ammonium transporter [Alkalibacter saccharofermentans]SHF10002.1 ammonium transporter (TC 1.A.11) [Alkalibacter saccharofermentans DSM 14828]
MDMEMAVSLDTVWVLLGAVLVFFMQAGFAMVETGFTRAKNAGNIIMKNIMDFSVGSIIYWVFGFGIMFGDSIGGVIGSLDLFVKGTYDFGVPTFAFLIFQTVFCATAATIVSGAMAERTKFVSYLSYSFFISLIIYPIVGHWIWGGGFLAELGFVDFAGSTVVHSVGGWAALVGAAVIGPRIGKYTKEGKAKVIPGHSITLGALGVFILWFGWFGFNPGSQLAASGLENAEAIASIFITTNLAAAMGAIMSMAVTWIKYGKPDVSMTLNGALAGLVGITAGTASVTPIGAAIIGAIAGVVIVFSVEFVDHVLKIDDPVGAVSVHGVCGALGTLMVGFFAVDGGLFYGGGASLLLTQLIGVLAVAAWTMTTAFILFKSIDKLVGLRVSREEELEGLDITEHGMESYADFQLKSIIKE